MSSSSASAASGEFVESRCTMPIHLHPSRLGNVREGVEEQINAMCMKYVDALGGVLLSYSDLSLSEDKSRNPLSCGSIFQERSYIHFRVELKALTWRCALGDRYSGVINAVASDHLSILLHGIFTATIPLSGASIPKGWRWEADRERWIDDSVYTGEEEATTKAEDDAVKDEDASDDDGAAAAPAASGKKLTKKELKKLERRKLRAVMLAATGRTGGGAAAVKPPAAGVIVRGVHVRFECFAIQHTDEYLKLTGTLVPQKNAAASKKHNDASASSTAPLGLTGGFTALAPLEGLRNNSAAGAADASAMEDVPEEPFLDLDAIAAVTAPMPGVKTNATATVAAARPAAAASAAAAPASSKKPLNAKQQERMEKKKAKLAERMAAKAAGAATTAAAAGSDDDDAVSVDDQAAPAKKQRVDPAAATATAEKKKRKGAAEENGAVDGKKHDSHKSDKKKKLKTES